jgi:hypothetical protein
MPNPTLEISTNMSQQLNNTFAGTQVGSFVEMRGPNHSLVNHHVVVSVVTQVVDNAENVKLANAETPRSRPPRRPLWKKNGRRELAPETNREAFGVRELAPAFLLTAEPSTKASGIGEGAPCMWPAPGGRRPAARGPPGRSVETESASNPSEPFRASSKAGSVLI